jgi:SAM-dependent methyltransferase
VVTSTQTGSAEIQGELWGSRPNDWAEIMEPPGRPYFEAVFEATAVGRGTRLLDAGCGAGMAARMAADRGARVTGLDAAEPLLVIARRRVPDGEFRAGELERLPFAEHSFDVVTGFNSFQYAADPVKALVEARRVARPGGSVAVVTWGRREECEAAAYIAALGSLLPPPPPGAPGPFSLSAPGALEGLVERAGLAPKNAADVEAPWEFPDLAVALRGMLSAGPAIRAIRVAGEEAVGAKVAEAIAPYRTSSGGYRLENSFRYLIAEA